MGKRLEEDFAQLIEQNGWSLNSTVTSDDCKKVVIYLGFVKSLEASDTRLLIELCRVLLFNEGILLENLLKCLKAIMNLLDTDHEQQSN